MTGGLAVRALTLRRPGFSLGPLSFDVAPGEALLVFGPSQAGKTQLLKALVGLAPASGQVCVDGIELSLAASTGWADLRARVGMVFQNDALFDSLSVRDNVALPIVRRGGRDDDPRIDALVAEVGLQGHGHKRPAQLSGGMRKRAGLARALAAAPPVLLIDEPLAGLDPGSQRRIAALLADVRDAGHALVVAVADPAPLWPLCRRALALDGGAVVAHGSAEAVRAAAAQLLGAA